MRTTTERDDETRLLDSLESAMQAARNLGMRDMEQILRMAVLELLNYHASQGPEPQPAATLARIRLLSS